MSKPRCDLHFKNKRRCSKEAYAEVSWKRKSTWSYLCKKHFKERRKKFYLWGILNQWWIERKFWDALRKVENKFGICQPRNNQWCLFVEFGNEIGKLSEKILKSVEKYRGK